MKLAKRHLPGLLVLVACGAAPPRSIEVSPDLPEGLQVAVARARDAWCEAPVGWCPDLVESEGEARIEVHHLARERKGAQMRNDGFGVIQVRPAIAGWSADRLTGAMTHEFGHFGIDGHVEDSLLMRERFGSEDEIPWDVDAEAVHEWCSQQGC